MFCYCSLFEHVLLVVQVLHPGSCATVSNTHVQLGLTITPTPPGSAQASCASNCVQQLYAYSCSLGASLVLDQCTVDLAASQQGPSGSSRHGNQAQPQLYVIGAFVPERTSRSAQPSPARLSSISMTDCKFSMRVPAWRTVSKAASIDKGGALEAARCTFTGSGLRLQCKPPAKL